MGSPTAVAFVSRDSGQTWKGTQGPTGCDHVFVDPFDASLYATNGFGLQHALDMMSPFGWVQIAEGTPFFDPWSPGTIYYPQSMPSGIVFGVTHDRGSTRGATGWPIDGTWGLAFDSTQKGVIYAYGNTGVVKTKDGGATWLPVTNGLDGEGVCSLSVAPDDGDQLFAATCGGAFYYSESGGE
jgi:hypothetical protein